MRVPAISSSRRARNGVGRNGSPNGASSSNVARPAFSGRCQYTSVSRALLGAGEDPRGGPAHAPVLIIANQPTWGLDIGAVAFVHQQLLDARAQGAAVLLISDDLDEIFALADRVAVMHAGHLTEARASGDWNLAAIGLAMAGSAPAASGGEHAA